MVAPSRKPFPAGSSTRRRHAVARRQAKGVIPRTVPLAPPRPLDSAVEARDVVRALRDYGFTQATIAQAVGAAERSVRNWGRTSAIGPKNEERLQELRRIVLLLRDSLSPRGVGQWFRARNRVLKGRRPAEVFAAGRIDAVGEAAEAYIEGAYV